MNRERLERVKELWPTCGDTDIGWLIAALESAWTVNAGLQLSYEAACRELDKLRGKEKTP